MKDIHNILHIIFKKKVYHWWSIELNVTIIQKVQYDAIFSFLYIQIIFTLGTIRDSNNGAP